MLVTHDITSYLFSLWDCVRCLCSIIKYVLTLLFQARNLHTGELAAVKIIKLEPGKFSILFCVFELLFFHSFPYVYFHTAEKLQTKAVFGFFCSFSDQMTGSAAGCTIAVACVLLAISLFVLICLIDCCVKRCCSYSVLLVQRED